MKVSDVVDAIEENGAPQYFGWFESPNKESFCALGMAAHNLGVDPGNLNSGLVFNVPNKLAIIPEGFGEPPSEIHLAEIIVNLNDEQEKSFEEIATILRNTYPEFLDRDIVVEDPTRLWK